MAKRFAGIKLSLNLGTLPKLFGDYLPRNATTFECSALNSGTFFDLELPATWKDLTGWESVKLSVCGFTYRFAVLEQRYHALS